MNVGVVWIIHLLMCAARVFCLNSYVNEGDDDEQGNGPVA